MIKLSNEQITFVFNKLEYEAHAFLSVNLGKDASRICKVEVRGVSKPFDCISFVKIYPEVNTMNPDELRVFLLSKIDELKVGFSNQVEIHCNAVRSIMGESRERLVIVNEMLFNAIDKVVSTENNPEYTKQRIIDYLKKVLITSLDKINHESDEKSVAFWMQQCVDLKKEVAILKAGGVK